ncbi:MAG: RHS repeat domain-containing protein [Flavobacterium sp.]
MRKLFKSKTQQIFFALFYLNFMGLFAQGNEPTISTDMPTIIPPSPSVAALMKFEEVPVNNYTGIPNVSVPLFSTGSHAKDINLNLALSYHPLSINANEVASHTGLGWSLMAGGSISRTVRDFPDEIMIGDRSKVGIYVTSSPYNGIPLANYDINRTYNMLASSGLTHLNYTTMNSSFINEYLWYINEKGKFDTKHDLWQFNFMGNTGRFIIEKNSFGQLNVKILSSNNNLRILHDYNTSNFQTNSFTIIDSKGFKYYFQEKEISTTNNVTSSSSVHSNSDTMSQPYTYVSALHLKKIEDINNNILITFDYQETSNEITRTGSQSTNVITNITSMMSYLNMTNQQSKIPPTSVSSVTNTNTNSKKVSLINVIDYAKIEFTYETGREDDNLTNPHLAKKLTDVIIKTNNNTLIKRFKLNYGYSTIIDKRLILNEIQEFDNSTNSNPGNYSYHFSYARPEINIAPNSVTKDYWGFFRKFTNVIGSPFNRDTDPNYCYADVLEKMTLPTGGAIIFDYESNDYAFEGNSSLTDFDNNPNNWTNRIRTKTFTSANSVAPPELFFTINEGTNIEFQIENTFNQVVPQNWVYHLYNANNLTQSIATLTCPENQNNCFVMLNLPAGTYHVKFQSFDISLQNNTFQAKITVTEKNRVQANLYQQKLLGGGIRIKTIGHFEEDNVSSNYYKLNNQMILPVKEKKFFYNLVDESFNLTNKSSGSLVFARPVFDYNKTVNVMDDGGGAVAPLQFLLEVHTELNNLKNIKTQGNDVGYKNVTIKEFNNGKSYYEYTSPIDFPEIITPANTDFPFHAPKNIDYKRGHLLKQIVFDQNNKKLKETNNQYNYVNEVEYLFGFDISSAYSSPISSQYETYQHFASAKNGCSQSSPIYSLCGYLINEPWPHAVSITFPMDEAYGWVQLTHSSTKEYFYEGSNTNIVEKNEHYTYNPVNKQIASQTTLTNNGEEIKNEFFYLNPNGDALNNRISEIRKIEAYRNNELSAVSEIDYTPFPNHPHGLPQKVKTSKENLAFEDKILYNQYDLYGNPLEVQQPNGMRISYIWGYNHTQPVAKIENMAYSAIPANLIADIHAAAGNADLEIKLNLLRSNAALANAMITTYLYKPLVGVTKITDPKGDDIYYEYDAFNRLKTVKDKDGKLLSENDYHYRTQQP